MKKTAITITTLAGVFLAPLPLAAQEASPDNAEETSDGPIDAQAIDVARTSLGYLAKQASLKTSWFIVYDESWMAERKSHTLGADRAYSNGGKVTDRLAYAEMPPANICTMVSHLPWHHMIKVFTHNFHSKGLSMG